ncbi:amastin-like protein [Leptomonas pyrrhocoris]|uniref:Amastin-like protein n=1 Tax=Leptomonas pyrrhocoris TaxID=157538 RepID=A0A0M9G4A5_LEPPY|nr:amastin-like protein [Leptomonas pyrrhocoris]XP_015660579.1 amastin-like protein [Leptomonas pyrrhocoris]XP_015660580.1 amastin-like protein [Leptomonas pyrrhocoris]KPA82139.1 amastin-like protein [Leptomonas pyrrhocoris]KPA82140.1 amastin-like protein [Leptomonas pyrrhocoris]KPA82141.1 amastin-like protein [Leptomonas pyrrhocoris]|eukprot:XP_015660578.1 amastin-like protein [Leptomonas pyrrhocoris]
MGVKVGIVIYSILQFIAFLLILVGTPIDMFRAKNEDTIGNKPCVTMWGIKEKCYSTKYDIRPKDLFALCKGRLDRFRAAEAFAIINIAIYLVACILGFVQLCCCHCLRWVCLLLNILGISAVVTWAIMADAFGSKSGADRFNIGYCGKLKDFSKYGAGFGLFVTAWCLDIVNIVFLMLPC